MEQVVVQSRHPAAASRDPGLGLHQELLVGAAAAGRRMPEGRPRSADLPARVDVRKTRDTLMSCRIPASCLVWYRLIAELRVYFRHQLVPARPSFHVLLAAANATNQSAAAAAAERAAECGRLQRVLAKKRQETATHPIPLRPVAIPVR